MTVYTCKGRVEAEKGREGGRESEGERERERERERRERESGAERQEGWRGVYIVDTCSFL